MKISEDEFLSHREKYLQLIRDGAVFIYPTDTIYGIGCDATNDSAVEKIREIKKRDNKPFSIIAPSIKWIIKNCEVKKEDLDKLPGPYTYVLKSKDTTVSKKIAPDSNLLGLRIPNSWFSDIVSELNIPIVTTSVNISGKKHMTCLKDLNENIRDSVDFIIYVGEKKGNPSTIIKIIDNKKEEIKRWQQYEGNLINIRNFKFEVFKLKVLTAGEYENQRFSIVEYQRY